MNTEKPVEKSESESDRILAILDNKLERLEKITQSITNSVSSIGGFEYPEGILTKSIEEPEPENSNFINELDKRLIRMNYLVVLCDAIRINLNRIV